MDARNENTYIYIHTYIQKYTYTNTYIYTHTYISIYIYIDPYQLVYVQRAPGPGQAGRRGILPGLLLQQQAELQVEVLGSGP